jgi:hypothetical protein
MDDLTRRHLQAVDRFIASLTPEQRALAKVKALRADQCTTYQQSLAEDIARTTPQGNDTSTIGRVDEASYIGGKQRALSGGLPERLGRCK